MTFSKAVEIISENFKDKSEGSVYFVWQSMLACILMDEGIEHEKANKIARKFLDKI